MEDWSVFGKLASGVLATVVAGGAILAPSPAKAWWAPVYGRPVVVVPGYPPPVVVAVPPRRIWVPPHYNRFGYFVPGHWR